MLLTKFREQYETKTFIIGKVCSRYNLLPNHLTLLAFLFGLGAGASLWFWHYKTAIVFMILSGLADVADGATARHLRNTSPFGAVLDRVSDRYVEFFVAVGCIGSGLVHPFWVVFALFGAVMASYTRACAESVGKVPNCAVGLMERQEKAGLFVTGIVLEPLLNPTSLPAIQLHPFYYPFEDGVLALQLAVIAVGIFSHFTVISRLIHTMHHSNDV